MLRTLKFTIFIFALTYGISLKAQTVSNSYGMKFAKIPAGSYYRGYRNYFHWGSNTMNLKYAFIQKNSNEKFHAVGKKRPNKFGIYDLWGNVWEWTSTRHDTSYGNFRVGIEGSKDPVDPVLLIIKKPVKINPALNRPMLQAAYAGNNAKTRDLLSRGADQDARFRGWTTLMYAAYFGHGTAVDALLESGASARIRHGGWDAASLARRRGHKSIQHKLEKASGIRATRPSSSRPRPPRLH